MDCEKAEPDMEIYNAIFGDLARDGENLLEDSDDDSENDSEISEEGGKEVQEEEELADEQKLLEHLEMKASLESDIMSDEILRQ